MACWLAAHMSTVFLGAYQHPCRQELHQVNHVTVCLRCLVVCAMYADSDRLLQQGQAGVNIVLQQQLDELTGPAGPVEREQQLAHLLLKVRGTWAESWLWGRL